MAESTSAITVRLLAEEDWKAFKAVRLAALEESPTAFVRTLAEESAYDEQTWRARMLRSRRLIAEVGDRAVGVVCLGQFDDNPAVGDLFGLWVAPDSRKSGVAWRMVEAVARQAVTDGYTRLYYWVGNENGRAIAFASNFGFRVSGTRRTARVQSEESGRDEIAMELSLDADPGSGGVPNPNDPRVAGRSDPGA